MSITIKDRALCAAMEAAGAVELRDPDGRLIGRFLPDGYGRLPPGVKSPFTDAELEERSKTDEISDETPAQLFARLEAQARG